MGQQSARGHCGDTQHHLHPHWLKCPHSGLCGGQVPSSEDASWGAEGALLLHQLLCFLPSALAQGPQVLPLGLFVWICTFCKQRRAAPLQPDLLPGL